MSQWDTAHTVHTLCTVWKNGKFTAMQFFPSNQFIVKFFSKTLIWRNFCEKTVAVKFRNFHSVRAHCRSHTQYINYGGEKFRESIFVVLFHTCKEIGFTEIVYTKFQVLIALWCFWLKFLFFLLQMYFPCG